MKDQTANPETAEGFNIRDLKIKASDTAKVALAISAARGTPVTHEDVLALVRYAEAELKTLQLPKATWPGAVAILGRRHTVVMLTRGRAAWYVTKVFRRSWPERKTRFSLDLTLSQQRLTVHRSLRHFDLSVYIENLEKALAEAEAGIDAPPSSTAPAKRCCILLDDYP